MEKLVKRLFIGGTLALAVAVSFAMQPTTRATESEGTPITENSTFTLTVTDALQLSSVNGAALAVTPGVEKVGSLDSEKIRATVQTNVPYNLTLHAAQPNLSLSTDGNKQIVADPAAGWSVQKNDGDFAAVTDTATTFASGPKTGATTVNIALPVKVVAPTNLQDGVYSTEVTVTLAKSA